MEYIPFGCHDTTLKKSFSINLTKNKQTNFNYLCPLSTPQKSVENFKPFMWPSCLHPP